MKKLSSWFALFIVVGLHLGLWLLLEMPKWNTPWYGTVQGVSFSPYRIGQSPMENIHPTEQEIDEDLATLAPLVKSVRIYSAIEMNNVPRLADKYGLEVTAGAWLSADLERNRQEIDALIELTNSHPNITRVLVGNEVLLRNELTPDALYAYLDEVRSKVRVPVSTAEARNEWMVNDDLGKHVDFITAHILPYWERTTIDDALPFTLREYDNLQLKYPGKEILIGEIGWPSQGSRFGGAVPSPTNQANFIRGWLDIAKQRDIDYFIIEAFDQPWKKTLEGSAGPYWGIFNAERQAKFRFSNPLIENDPTWHRQIVISSLLGLMCMLWFMATFRQINWIGMIFYFISIQSAVSLLTISLFLPQTVYLSLPSFSLLMVMVVAQIALLSVVLINAFEFTELLWRKDWQRSFKPLSTDSTRTKWPKVSIHVACYNEPVELVKQTLNQLAKLDYPNFEVLVIDNNTPDESTWRPIAEHCKLLGEHFRFFHIAPWGGFKAGALNFGLDMTAKDAQMIAVIDADYLVEKNWLKALIPYFDRAEVGFVQAPQDHREWENDRFKTMINWEYAGFFNIGMVHRNERNAIIQHGTMTIIRKSVLIEAGNWGEWCICEDTELGLRMMQRGYEAVYVNHAFGRGVVPDSFTAYKTQRFRWAYGAVQILRRYWKDLLPFNDSGLTRAQKFHFITGWLPWFADALHLVFSVGALIWGVGILWLPQYFEFPMPLFLFSVLVLFLLKIIHGLVLYTSRVPCSFRQRVGASIAGMALTHVVGRAMIAGLISPEKPFLRTPKGEQKPALTRGFLMAREETLLCVAMWLMAISTILFYGANLKTGFNWQETLQWKEALYWSILLIVQSLPYFAAFILSMINVWPTQNRKDSV